MKCVEFVGVIRRLPNAEARKAVKSGKGKFVSKTKWRAAGKKY